MVIDFATAALELLDVTVLPTPGDVKAARKLLARDDRNMQIWQLEIRVERCEKAARELKGARRADKVQHREEMQRIADMQRPVLNECKRVQGHINAMKRAAAAA